MRLPITHDLPPKLSRSLKIPIWALLAIVVAAVLAGGAVTWRVVGAKGEPAIVKGTVTAVNHDGTTIGFSADGGHREGESLVLVAGMLWTDTAGGVHGGTHPDCLRPGTSGQRVELAILDIEGSGDWPTKAVVWVRCLT